MSAGASVQIGLRSTSDTRRFQRQTVRHNVPILLKNRPLSATVKGSEIRVPRFQKSDYEPQETIESLKSKDSVLKSRVPITFGFEIAIEISENVKADKFLVLSAN